MGKRLLGISAYEISEQALAILRSSSNHLTSCKPPPGGSRTLRSRGKWGRGFHGEDGKLQKIAQQRLACSESSQNPTSGENLPLPNNNKWLDQQTAAHSLLESSAKKMCQKLKTKNLLQFIIKEDENSSDILLVRALYLLPLIFIPPFLIWRSSSGKLGKWLQNSSIASSNMAVQGSIVVLPA